MCSLMVLLSVISTPRLLSSLPSKEDATDCHARETLQEELGLEAETYLENARSFLSYRGSASVELKRAMVSEATHA